MDRGLRTTPMCLEESMLKLSRNRSFVQPGMCFVPGFASGEDGGALQDPC